MSTPRLDTSRPCRLRGVAFVVPAFDAPRGRGPRRLAEALAGQGVPVTYVTDAAPGLDAPRVEVRGTVQVYRVRARSIGSGATSRDLLELFALGLLAARRERVDAVYGVHPLGAAAAVRVARALGAPAVVELAAHPDGAWLRDADVVVAPTAALALEAEQALALPPGRVLRCARGVDLEAFAPRPSPAGRRSVLVAPAGQAAGEAALHAALEPVARARGLALVRHEGQPGPELQRDLAAWVLPAPSEAPQDALLEALACGVPVVAAPSPGLDAAADDGHVARAAAGDPAALAAALARVLDDAELATRLGKAARARAQEAFDLQQAAARHALLFEALRRPARLDAALVARAAVAAAGRAGRDAVRALGARLLGETNGE